jgi:hypothetical protein
VLLALGASGCSRPRAAVEFTVDIPDDVIDARGRFAEIFCAVLEARRTEVPDYRPCADALSPVRPAARPTGKPVYLAQSRRHLVAAIVPGIGWSCVAEWLQPPETMAPYLEQSGYDQIRIDVEAFAGVETNAQRIRDAILARPAESGLPRLVLIGYSKGAPDILEAVVRYHEIHDRVAAVVSSAGAIGGAAIADHAEEWQAELLRLWPGAECERGASGAVASVRTATRKQWLRENVLPDSIPYYSLVTLPTPERISRVVEPSYRLLGATDWRNDSQLYSDDEIIPGSKLLGFVNADHWAIAIPVNRSHPAIARTLADQNAFPREALIEAILRFIEEDLESD